MKMNEATNRKTERRSPEELDKLIIEAVSENPKGVRFNEILSRTGISPSTLSQHLARLQDDLRIEKKEDLYLVEGLGSYMTIVNICMSEIEGFLNSGKGSKNIIFVLDEIIGSPGNPVPAGLSDQYMKLVDPGGIDTLFRMIRYIRDRKPADLLDYETGLVQFATGAVICTCSAGKESEEDMKSLLRQLNSLEKEIIKSIGPEGLKDRNSRTMKLIDRVLYAMAHCNSITWDVIDGMIGICEGSGNECFEYLYSFMVNSSLFSSELAAKVLFNNQGKLFTKALKSENPEEKSFLQKLRRYAIDIHDPQSGSGAANPRSHDTEKGPG
jgi:DNA-binding transcriptional ArsR family regulator